MSGSTHKRLRRKSRKLSEAEHGEIAVPLVTKKKRGRPSVTSTIEQEEEQVTERRFIVSFQTSVIGARFISRLKRKSTSHSSGTSSSSSNNKEPDSPAPVMPAPQDTISPRKAPLELMFKNPSFSYSLIDKTKKRTWKSLKQILQSDLARMDSNHLVSNYSSIEAPPPIKPTKKYSDVSGLLSNYTDPLTGLQFSSSEEFEFIRTLPTNVVQGYLSLRGKATIT